MADQKCYRPSIAYPDMAINMEMIRNQFGPEMDSSISLKNFNTSITDYSVANFFGCKTQHVFGHDHHHQNPTNLSDQDLPAASHSNHDQLMIINDFNESKKRKVNVEDVFSIAASKNGLEDKEKSLEKNSLVKENNYRSRKNNNKKEDKKEEVIHVRARRGQATDSHSLAERVRREKINSKFRCLQDLVPGCSKTMGMTMMLDEIISYVHSLQNQIEFLSTELAAACSYQSYTYIKATRNSETFSQDPQEMEKMRAQLLPFNMV